MAACLRSGLPLERAVRAVVPVLPAAAGDALGRVADLLVLGADPATAWAPALDQPSTARLARAARRSARSGSAVAAVAEAHAVDVRAEAAEAVAARAERAGVLVTGPLGLCFLPAFLALGIVPVVVGLAGPLLEQR
jgi:pilus assembly protein TadC